MMIEVLADLNPEACNNLTPKEIGLLIHIRQTNVTLGRAAIQQERQAASVEGLVDEEGLSTRLEPFVSAAHTNRLALTTLRQTLGRKKQTEARARAAAVGPDYPAAINWPR